MVAGRIAGAGALTAIAALVALAPVAQGLTIGSTARPWGSTPGACPIYGTPGAITQGGGTAPSWRTPRGALTSWSMNVTGAPAGGQVRLTVIRGLTIVAIETGTIGDSLPPGGIAVYRPATPIAVAEGDRIAVGGDSVAACAFVGGVVPPDQSIALAEATPGIAVGASLFDIGGGSIGGQINLAAEVEEPGDLRVSAAAGPANALAGQLAQLSATVTNAGPAASRATVTTLVPAGLAITAAASGGGSCEVAGQTVTCEIDEIAVGASVPVVVLVTPAAAGEHAVEFAVAGPLGDLEPSDNSAAATLTVAALPMLPETPETPTTPTTPTTPATPTIPTTPTTPTAPTAVTPRCVVPSLAGASLGVVRSLLPQLRCKLGKVTKASSRRIAKGAVIATRPGRGEYAEGSAIAVVVSSGKPVRRASRRGVRRPARRSGR